MKKSLKIFLILVAIIIASYVIFTYFPFGLQKYQSKNSDITFNVPGFSTFKEECCMFNASFKSIRSTFSIKKELEKELKNYEKVNCNNKTYYYNKNQDFTITEYYVNNGFIFNNFSITFDKGNLCSSSITIINIEGHMINKTITNKEEIDLIILAIDNKEEKDGILDVTKYNYKLQIINDDTLDQEWLLWIDKNSVNAMIMDSKETHIGYLITSKDTENLKQILGL